MTSHSRHSFSLVPAVYIYLLRGETVLLQLRQNTGFMDGTWAAAAAGHIEPGETASAAARREAGEELGIELDDAQLTPVTAMQRTDGTATPREQRVDFFFTSRTWRGTPRIAEPAKCAEVAWFALDELPAAMPPHERFVLERICAGGMPLFSAFGF